MHTRRCTYGWGNAHLEAEVPTWMGRCIDVDEEMPTKHQGCCRLCPRCGAGNVALVFA